MKLYLTILLAALMIAGISGCGIIGGAGKDISSAGHLVTKSANAVKNTISN